MEGQRDGRKKENRGREGGEEIGRSTPAPRFFCLFFFNICHINRLWAKMTILGRLGDNRLEEVGGGSHPVRLMGNPAVVVLGATVDHSTLRTPLPLHRVQRCNSNSRREIKCWRCFRIAFKIQHGQCSTFIEAHVTSSDIGVSRRRMFRHFAQTERVSRLYKWIGFFFCFFFVRSPG